MHPSLWFRAADVPALRAKKDRDAYAAHLWDRLFGTFEEEDEPVVYGLTSNIESYDPARIATHEWADIAADVAAADTWHDRWSFLLRRPGWAYARRPAAGVA